MDSNAQRCLNFFSRRELFGFFSPPLLSFGPRACLQESEFFELLQLYFPKLYDIKYLVSSQDGFHGGLNKLADDLKVGISSSGLTPSPRSASKTKNITTYLFFVYCRQTEPTTEKHM